ncbi:MAG: hypothetical protein ISR51_09500, partial [Rhodospirillales bacterium]|nr:hypothetical protein [Rhodospirillales bacterium]
DNGNGSWTLSPADLANLTVTPAADSDADFSLSVTATSTDGTDTATTTATVNVGVTGVADQPALTFSVGDPVVSETDGGVSVATYELDISAGLADTDGSETLGITISGVPDGSVLSAGTDNGDGTWTVAPDQLENLSLTVPTGDGGSGTPFELGGADFTGSLQEMIGSWNQTIDGHNVTISALNLDGSTGQITGDEGRGIGVAGLGDTEIDATSSGSETMVVDFDGLVVQSADVGVRALFQEGGGLEEGHWEVFRDGELVGSGDFEALAGAEDGRLQLSIGPDEFSGAGFDEIRFTAAGRGDDFLLEFMQVTPVDDGGTDDFQLTVTATATENDGDTAAISASADVVIPEGNTDTTAEDPTLTAGPVTGQEDTAIALDISAALTDTDGSETLSVTIAGVPSGAVLSAGIDNEDGTWTVDGADIGGLTITPPSDSNVDFDLTVTATSTESASGDTATSTATVSVDVVGVADTPTVFTQIDPDSASYQDAVEAREPIAYFRMNEVDDENVVDSAGNLTATYERGAESKDDKHGIGEGAGDFDGRNDHIDVEHDASLELPSGSITLWFNSDDVDDRQGLFSKDSSGYDEGGHLTGYIDDGEVKIRLQSGEDSYWVDGGSLSDNTWHQVTFNFGEGGMELYVDGQLVDTNDYTGGIENNTEPMVIGANAWSSSDGESDNLRDYFDGQIDEVAIMDHPLNANDVSSLYTTGGHAIQDNGGTVGGDLLEGITFNLEITGALGDLDGSETLAIVIDGVPSGASLSAGIDNGDGSWTLTTDDLGGLTVNTDYTVVENFDLTVTAVATEDDGDTATAITTVPVIVDETVDADVSLEGSRGDDVLFGGTGDDVLKGRGGDDELIGGGGEDTLFGSSGDDVLDGGTGADTLFGSSGRDELKGGEGDDYLDGGSSDDVIDGGAGNDFIKGGRGDDVITGGAGTDTMEGGEGADAFMFDSQSGHDIITDILEQDVLVFEGQEFHMDDLVLSENTEGDVVVTFGGVEDTSVTLDGVSLDDLDRNHDGDPSDGYSVTDSGDGVTITIDNVG